jgi:hypothetical protein
MDVNMVRYQRYIRNGERGRARWAMMTVLLRGWSLYAWAARTPHLPVFMHCSTFYKGKFSRRPAVTFTDGNMGRAVLDWILI